MLKPRSDAQVKLIRKLLTEYAAFDRDAARNMWDLLNNMDREGLLTGGWPTKPGDRNHDPKVGTASKIITNLQNKIKELKGSPAQGSPLAEGPTPVAPERTKQAYADQRAEWDRLVPEGSRSWVRFALPSDTGNNDLDFFEVKRTRKGFYDVYRQAGPNSYKITRWPLVQKIMNTFASNPVAFGKLYADNAEKCFRCDLPLTDFTSRFCGCGEKCAGIMGVPYMVPDSERAKEIARQAAQNLAKGRSANYGMEDVKGAPPAGTQRDLDEALTPEEINDLPEGEHAPF